MATLHKQNFDLKLELFHRRERQTVLEEQIELLDASKTQAEETNATLLHELEKRDKAVSEAVHMIISLETRIDLLLREREMTRQLESDKAFLSHLAQSPSTTLASHMDTTRDNLHSSLGDRKRPSQASSFMSGQTESLEAFRRSGLDSDASYPSLLKTDSREGSDHGFASPSILSESSFASVYGQRDTRDSSVPPDISTNASRTSKGEARGRRSISASTRDFTPPRSQRIESLSSRDGARSAMDNRELTTPLRKTSNDHNTSTQVVPMTHGADRSETVRPLKQQPLMRLRGHRERPVRKIISDESTPNNNYALPPTPDTATSSILRHGLQPASPASHLALKRSPGEGADKTALNEWRFQDPALMSPHAPSFTAFTGRIQSSGTTLPDLQSLRLRRPRSADETTISRHKNGWESESELDDAVSEVSSFDYWMKEGLQPSRGGAVPPASSHNATNRDPPNEDVDWRNDDLFGTAYVVANGPSAPVLDDMGASLLSPETGLYGSGLAGSSSPQPVGSSMAPPPAPYRHSSLSARTSAPSTPFMANFAGKLLDHDVGKKRSVSGQTPLPPRSNEWAAPRSRSQTPTLPAHTQHQQPEHPAQKDAQKRHYPPQTSQQLAARPRSRGITSLFRRSMGSGPMFPTSASVPATESPFAPPPQRDYQAPQVGVPSWERRNELVHDMPSATPPPIMRNKAAAGNMETDSDAQSQGMAAAPAPQVLGRGVSMDIPGPGLGAGLRRVNTSEDGGGGAPLGHRAAPRQSQEMSFPPSSLGHGHGHGRKWFGLGRMTGLRHAGS